MSPTSENQEGWPPRVTIGVIDILDGQVVAAREGRREAYQPVRMNDRAAFVSDIIEMLHGKAICQFYLADLDALTGKTRQWDLLHEFLESLWPGDSVWLDLGIQGKDAEQSELADRHFYVQPRRSDIFLTWILATESLRQIRSLREVVRCWRSHVADPPFALGVDFRAGQFLGEDDPESWLAAADELGIRQGVPLDVARVGTFSGDPLPKSWQNWRFRYPSWTWISGGGVRNRGDLQSFVDSGCDRVLVGRALRE